MADIADTLKSILGDDAEDKIKDVLGSLSTDSSANVPDINNSGLNEIMQLRSMIESMTSGRNDPRTNLLRALRPYMREERKQSIDSAVRLMGIANIIKMLGK